MNFPKWLMCALFFIIAHTMSLQAFFSYDSSNYQRCCSTFNNQCCDLKLSVYGDALYWKFLRADLEFVILDEEEEEAILDHLKHDWTWGYRVGGYICSNNWSMEIRYTSICDTKKRRIADAKHKYDYDVVDVDLGYTCCIPCCNLRLTPIIGGKFAWIDDNFRKIEPIEVEFDGKMDFKGYGLYLGLISRWELCNKCFCGNWLPISLVGRATTGVLQGKFELDTNVFDKITDECLYVPVQDLYVALEFAFNNPCGLGAFLQVGYEVQSWGNWREWFSDEDTNSWGIGGLVIRAGFNF